MYLIFLPGLGDGGAEQDCDNYVGPGPPDHNLRRRVTQSHSDKDSQHPRYVERERERKREREGKS